MKHDVKLMKKRGRTSENLKLFLMYSQKENNFPKQNTTISLQAI